MVSQTSIGSIPKPSEFLKKFIANCNGSPKKCKEQPGQLLAPPGSGAATPNEQG